MPSHSRHLAFIFLLLLAESAQAGIVKDSICAGVSITRSVLPAVISLVALGASAWALYMKAGGDWIQGLLKGVLAAAFLASIASIAGFVAGAGAAQMFNCAAGAGAMQQIINNL